LFGNDSIYNEAHYVASNLPIFLNAEFVVTSININQFKFHFVPNFQASTSTKNVQWE